MLTCGEEARYLLELMLTILRVSNTVDAGHLPQVDVQAAPKLKRSDVMGSCGAEVTQVFAGRRGGLGHTFKNPSECFVMEAQTVRVKGVEDAGGPEFGNKANPVAKT